MKHDIPKIPRPRGGGFRSLSAFPLPMPMMAYGPTFNEGGDPSLPLRKRLVVPDDRGTFVKPLKQVFIRNPRTMPMTRIMLALLAGWAGQGGRIDTTVGVIGKHIGRCRRQVFRYLRDAAEEGLLTYSRTKDRVGRYTGIRVWLNFGAIRYESSRKKTGGKVAASLGVTLKSETNGKHIYNGIKDGEISAALERMAMSFGLEPTGLCPT
jgi:hypothetical protein